MIILPREEYIKGISNAIDVCIKDSGISIGLATAIYEVFIKGLVKSILELATIKNSIEDTNKALDIIDKLQFFNCIGGRKLWFDKPSDVQQEDIENTRSDLEYLRKYILG